MVSAPKKKGWEASAKQLGKWYGRVEAGVQRFMEGWHQREGDAKEKRRLKREEKDVEDSPDIVAEGLKRRRAGDEESQEKRRQKGARAGEKPPGQRSAAVEVLDGESRSTPCMTAADECKREQADRLTGFVCD